MSLLSDADIMERLALPEGDLRRLVIEPFLSEKVREPGLLSYGLESVGYGIRLGDELGYIQPLWECEIGGERIYYVDPANPRSYSLKTFALTDHGYILMPGATILGVSLEHISYPRDVKANLLGKSTIARVSVSLNTTMMEPGWRGKCTIEITNNATFGVLLKPFMGIGQLEFQQALTVPLNSYSGAYQDAVNVEGPK